MDFVSFWTRLRAIAPGTTIPAWTVDHGDHSAAEATAKHGLDSNQVDQANVTADVAADLRAGVEGVTKADRDEAAQGIVSARSDSSPK